MRRPAFFLASLVLAAAAHAQSPSPAPSPASVPATGFSTETVLEVLRLDGAANFLIPQGYDVHASPPRTAEQAREIEAMYGKLATGSSGDTDTTIKEFTKKYGTLLGLPAGQDGLQGMRKFREFATSDGKWIQYCPQADGLDFISALMTYVFRDNGTLCAVMGRYRPVTGPVGGSLAREDAIRKAQERLKLDFPYDEVDVTGPVKIAECLVDDIDKNPGVVKLVAVTLDVGAPPRPKRVLMLGSGDVLWSEDGAYGGCTGKIFKQDPVTDGETLTKEDLLDIEHPGSFWKSYIINGKNVKVNAPDARQRASAFFGGFSEEPFEPDPSDTFAEINAYHHITKAWKSATDAGITPTELAPFTPLYFDHWATPNCGQYLPSEEDPEDVKAQKEAQYDECVGARTANAWFDPTSHSLNFAAYNDGIVRKTVDGKETYKHSAYEATVMVHEFGHWIHYILNPHHNLTGNFGSNLEARAAQEAVADVFAAVTCGNPVIAGYFLGANKRDISVDTKYRDVLPLWPGTPEAGKPGREYHNAGIALASAFWRLKGDMGDGPLLKNLIAAMRVCHMPCRFQNVALAALAMDQLMSASPQGRRMADRFVTNQLVQNVLYLVRP